MIGRRTGLACCIACLGAFALGWITLAVSPGPVAWAQENDRVTVEVQSENSVLPAISSRSTNWLAWLGTSLGPFYSLLFLLLTFCLVALIVLNVLAIRRSRMVPHSLLQVCQSYVDQKRPQEAYSAARADPSLLGKVFAAGLTKLSSGHDAAAQAMQETGADEALRLEHQLGYLSLVAQVAPLVGLLGTVDGMASAFEAIAVHNQSPRPADLAQGIGTALVATIVSLWIAIPAEVMFNILRARLARYLFDAGVVSETLLKRFAMLAEKKA
jgi:biopolymer transport protein ExbB